MACDCDTGGLPATAQTWSHPTASIGDKHYSRSIRQPQCPGKATLSHPLEKLSYWAQRTETAQSCPSSLCSRGSAHTRRTSQACSERSWVRSMGARIRHIFLDYWDVLGRIQGEPSYCPRLLLQEKKKKMSNQEQKIEKSQLHPSRG